MLLVRPRQVNAWRLWVLTVDVAPADHVVSALVKPAAVQADEAEALTRPMRFGTTRLLPPVHCVTVTWAESE
jgi:hypothetical protein